MNKSKKIDLLYYNLNMLYFINFHLLSIYNPGELCSDKAAISLKMNFATILPLCSTWTTQAPFPVAEGSFLSKGKERL